MRGRKPQFPKGKARGAPEVKVRPEGFPSPRGAPPPPHQPWDPTPAGNPQGAGLLRGLPWGRTGRSPALQGVQSGQQTPQRTWKGPAGAPYPAFHPRGPNGSSPDVTCPDFRPRRALRASWSRLGPVRTGLGSAEADLLGTGEEAEKGQRDTVPCPLPWGVSPLHHCLRGLRARGLVCRGWIRVTGGGVLALCVKGGPSWRARGLTAHMAAHKRTRNSLLFLLGSSRRWEPVRSDCEGRPVPRPAEPTAISSCSLLAARDGKRPQAPPPFPVSTSGFSGR